MRACARTPTRWDTWSRSVRGLSAGPMTITRAAIGLLRSIISGLDCRTSRRMDRTARSSWRAISGRSSISCNCVDSRSWSTTLVDRSVCHLPLRSRPTFVRWCSSTPGCGRCGERQARVGVRHDPDRRASCPIRQVPLRLRSSHASSASVAYPAAASKGNRSRSATTIRSEGHLSSPFSPPI
jgi:hypothetical protein